MSQRVAQLVALLGPLLGLLASSAELVAQSEERWREQFVRARSCYELVDYRCVVTTLDGPLLLQRRPPLWLAESELLEAYELLGLSYLSLGLDAEAAQAFERLLALRPEYVLARPEASPEQIEKVALIRASRDAVALAMALAIPVFTQTSALARARMVRKAAATRAAALSAGALAEYVLGRCKSLAPGIESPPWGPWTGPVFALAAVARVLLGSDAQAWAPGFGVGARVGLAYRPLLLALALTWSRHQSLLQNTLIVPPPSLDILSVYADLAWSQRVWRLVLAGRLGVGVQYLRSRGMQSVNPALSAAVELSWPLDFGLALAASLAVESVFGQVHEHTGASLSVCPALGLSIAF